MDLKHSYTLWIYRHCVSTISPPGSVFPPNVQLPHEAAPAGVNPLPPGEGCYSCNVDSKGIPLEKPFDTSGKGVPLEKPLQRPSGFRFKRQAENGETVEIEVKK